METNLLSIKKLAERLQVCEATAREYLKAGLIPAKKIGRQWRVKSVDLEAFLSSVE